MTVHKRWELQAAITDLLTIDLAEQGLETDEGSDRPDIRIYDTDTENSDQLFVRLDGFAFNQGTGSAGRFDQYPFMVHVFCRENGGDSDLIHNEVKEVLRVQNLIISALDGFQPFEGAGCIQHRSSVDVSDSEPGIHHGISRFVAVITGD